MARKSKQLQLSPAARLHALFEGNQRASGRLNVAKDRQYTVDQPLTIDDWERHLAGKDSIGSIPIQDDDTCVWACIDMDNHGSDEDLPIAEVSQKVLELKLPLVLCRSRSGGIHAYAFFDKPIPAGRAQALLRGWAKRLGYGDSEVFPKQSKLTIGRDGKRMTGNFVNSPYQNAAKTGRYCVYDGKPQSLEEFLDLAERAKIKEAELRATISADHPEAPPCVQRMFANGVAQGHRNEALYQIVVYLRKKNDGDVQAAEAAAWDANSTVFRKPLGRAEAQRTIASALRPDYGFRCNEEPSRSLCDRDICLRRKFGITPSDAASLAASDVIPPFTDLVKYLTEPVRWEFKVDGVVVTNVSTEELFEFRFIRKIIAERLTKVVPRIKDSEWERILTPLMKEARVVETPDDASVNGVIRDRLREFAAKTDLTSRGEDRDDAKALLRGMPVVQVVDGVRCVVFRAQDFVAHLKRMRSEELKGVNLYFAVKNMGVIATRVRPGRGRDLNPISVWAIPVKQVLQHEAPGVEFKSEL